MSPAVAEMRKCGEREITIRCSPDPHLGSYGRRACKAVVASSSARHHRTGTFMIESLVLLARTKLKPVLPRQLLPDTGEDGRLAGHPVWNVRAVRARVVHLLFRPNSLRRSIRIRKRQETLWQRSLGIKIARTWRRALRRRVNRPHGSLSAM